jgi:superfamily II DNA or RNA helicase
MIIEINGILSHYGFCVKKKNIPKDLIIDVKNNFTLIPETTDLTVEPHKIKIYYEDEKYLILPKFYSNETLIIKKMFNDIEKIIKINFVCNKSFYVHDKINVKFNGELREHQNKIIEAVMNNFNEKKITYGFVLKLFCGCGKTSLGIYIMCKLSVKTLIIVHTKVLLLQWIERLKQFTNCSIGLIHRNKFEIDNNVCVAMLHTINSRYNADDLKSFGLVIYDECHHYGAKTYSQVLLKTQALYNLALTATYERQDCMHRIFNYFLGYAQYKLNREYVYKLFIKTIHFSNTDDNKYKEYSKKYNGVLTPDSIKTKTMLVENKLRNDLVVDLINNLKCKNRKIFVFSERINQLKYLKELVDNDNKIKNTEDIYKTYMFIGETKKEEKENATKHGVIIFVSIALAAEGLDINNIDSIIVASPIKQLQIITQLYGRIQRSQNYDSKKLPLIVEINDHTIPIFKKWGDLRKKMYERDNYFVDEYFYENNKLLYLKSNEDNINPPLSKVFENIDDETFIMNNLYITEQKIKLKKDEFDLDW